MILRNKNIIVTGGAGFIGSYLVDGLIKEKPAKIVVADNLFLGKRANLADAKRNFPVVFEKIDVADYKKMRDLFRAVKPDIVFNLAIVPLPTSLIKPKYAIDKNIAGTVNVCEFLKTGLFKTLIQFSSSEVYGTAKYVPMDEEHPRAPLTPYAASKAATDAIALSYYHTFGCDVRVVCPFNNYGPRQNAGSYAGVIPITIKRILDKKEPVLQGTGKQARDFIFVTDTVRGVIKAAKNDKMRGEFVNIADNQEIRIGDLIRMICREMGYRGKIIRAEKRAGDVFRHCASNRKARKLLGFKPEVNLKNGLEITINWYKKEFAKNNN